VVPPVRDARPALAILTAGALHLHSPARNGISRQRHRRQNGPARTERPSQRLHTKQKSREFGGQAEHCRVQAAEFRRRAEQASDISIKNELLEIANYWNELRSAYEAFERSKRSD
jgi:hypothetical protein